MCALFLSDYVGLLVVLNFQFLKFLMRITFASLAVLDRFINLFVSENENFFHDIMLNYLLIFLLFFLCKKYFCHFLFVFNPHHLRQC